MSNNYEADSGGGGGGGNVVGPSSATDSAVVLFDTTTGKLIKSQSVMTFSGSTLTLGDASGAGLLLFTTPSNIRSRVVQMNSSGVMTITDAFDGSNTVSISNTGVTAAAFVASSFTGSLLGDSTAIISFDAPGVGGGRFSVDTSGNLLVKGTIRAGEYLVSSLPPTPTGHPDATVIDSLTPLSTLGVGVAPTGGGVYVIPVYYDGSSWLSG